MKSEAFRSEKLGTLTGEYEQAAMSGRIDGLATGGADSLEVRLEETRTDHARLQTSNADFKHR